MFELTTSEMCVTEQYYTSGQANLGTYMCCIPYMPCQKKMYVTRNKIEGVPFASHVLRLCNDLFTEFCIKIYIKRAAKINYKASKTILKK